MPAKANETLKQATALKNIQPAVARRTGEYTSIEGVFAWEQQPEENTENYMMFTILMEFGPVRSIKKLERFLTDDGVEGIDISYNGLRHRAQRNSWLPRARLWDLELARISREVAQKVAAERAVNQIQTTDDMMSIARRGLAIYDTLIKEWQHDRNTAIMSGRAPPEPPLSVDECVKLVDVSTKVSQLVQGKPTEIQDQTKRTGLSPEFAAFARSKILGIGDASEPTGLIVEAVLEPESSNGNGNGASDG